MIPKKPGDRRSVALGNIEHQDKLLEWRAVMVERLSTATEGSTEEKIQFARIILNGQYLQRARAAARGEGK